MSLIYYLLLFHILHYVQSDDIEDAHLNFTQLATKYGLKCEEFEVTTDDNYILKLFHIKGNDKKPVLLVHGLLDCGETFIIRGDRSLAIVLANEDYDVWVLNIRGTKYGRKHVFLNPDTDKEFWDYSYHEMGTKDLPANIDFVLKKTKQPRLAIIGHSQGTQIGYVLTSILPEYNEKIQVIISLAPIAYIHNMPRPTSLIPLLWKPANVIMKTTGQEEFLKNDSLAVKLAHTVCPIQDIGFELCGKGLMFPVAGSDPVHLEPEFFPILFGHYPQPSSRKNIDHLLQAATRKKFSQYDYGFGNLKEYGALEPPDYPLNKITAPVALLVGLNDKLADVTDVNILRLQLANVFYHEMESKTFNHMDFVWGNNMNEELFPLIFKLLQKYTSAVI